MKIVRDIFKFKTDLLYDLIGSDAENDFNSIYVPPKLRISDETKKEISFKLFLNVLETKIIARQISYIEGKAGYGKTNLLKYIGWLTYQHQTAFKYAIYLRAKDIEESLTTFEKMSYTEKFLIGCNRSFSVHVKRSLKKIGVSLTESEIEFLTNERCILLIDGMDELKSTSNNASLVELLRTFRDEKPNVVIVANGRPGSLKSIKNDQIHPDFMLQILPLFKDGMRKIIEQTFQKMDKKLSSKDLHMRIITNLALFEIARVPLLLTLIIRLYSDGTEIPEHKNLLIEKFIDMALSRKLGVDCKPVKNAIESVLVKLAYNINFNKSPLEDIDRIWNEEAKLANDDTIKNAVDAINHSRSSGLLNHESNIVEFSHKSIQDYLYAKYLFTAYKNPNNRKNVASFLIKMADTEVIFFFCCLIDDASSVFQEFLKNKKLDLCMDLVIWLELGARIRISKSVITEYWNALIATENRELIARTKLILTLNKCKRGRNIASHPVTVDEYNLIVGDVATRHQNDGVVVGIDSGMINTFLVD